MSSVDNIQVNSYEMNLAYTNSQIATNENTPLKTEDTLKTNDDKNNTDEHINHQAVNLSISMQSMLVYVNVRSLEYAQKNTEAQDLLTNIFNNKEVFNFLDGASTEDGLDLKSIGYDGKPITQLSVNEAKDLISEEGFFGVDQTSQRVASFSMSLSSDNVEYLKEARKGLVKGFEEAEKLFDGKLPEISYETQEKTLELVDKRIDELLNKELRKEEDKEQA